ncbi:isoprenylcysteine carboxyl methyltransferase (ICMT) family protein [Mariprofundus micogutta]|uniref:Isoprenylcysteine carboxyl methyltransferase (ICMT) family protein n=1 Tax=Mariprofundus micogutta TaxID=1921010 RepID=A0A1L8CP80_9PROT|nr:isoprenylcysteine carboxylmethyltransferase family protein [Mariprofundus micogutta]GAV20639.1 isoprenylcysteine carboxyl methyltransferase (ICMT) family protein [Mariprofundus micogutta]
MHGGEEYAYGMWIVALFNVGIFMFFILSFLKPRGSDEWRSMGVVTAFLVALFAEMYGFPLTIFMLTSWLGEVYPALNPFSHKLGHLWVVVFGGSNFAWAIVMGLSLAFMLVGYTLLSKGWTQIHASRGKLVTNGIYAYARHPQYTGLFLVIIGFLIQWPTLITVLMAPLLLFAYTRLARFEERKALKEFGGDYRLYVEKTPAFFPPLKKWKDFLMVYVPDAD